MKKVKVILFLLVGWSIVFASDGLTVNSMSYNNHGEIVPFAAMEENEFLATLECREDTGAVDIVFAIDTSGRDELEMVDVIERVEAVVNLLDTLGYDYCLGLITFANRPVIIHDFDPTIPGYQMTLSKTDFFTELEAIDYDDSGDFTSNSTDAIGHAIIDYDWRPDALHIVVPVTDSPYYERGDGSGYADYLDTEVYDLVLSTGTVIFCASGSYESTSNEFYEMISYDSGGEFYERLFDPIALTNDILDLLTIWSAINVNFTYDCSDPGNVNCLIEPRDSRGVEILSSNPWTTRELSMGDSITISFHVEIDSTITGIGRCFDVILRSPEDTLVVTGCYYNDSCFCEPPAIKLARPFPLDTDYVYTSCTDMNIDIAYLSEFEEIDSTSFTFEINGTEYIYPDHIEITDSDILWIPDAEWEHGDSVFFKFYGLADSHGCASFDTIIYGFIVDLEDPVIIDISPDDGEAFDSTFYISFLANDDLSGIDRERTKLTIEGVEYDAEEPLVTYTESSRGTNVIVTGSPYVYGDLADSAITICLEIFDNTQPSSCDTNSVEICNTYTINYIPTSVHSFTPGWNLISNPCENPFYIYDEFSFFPYLDMFTLNCDGLYENPDSLDVGTGAWVLSPEPIELHFDCEGVDTLIYNLCRGWSIIGVSSFPVLASKFTETETYLNGPLKYDSEGFYIEVDTLYPNIGYWMLYTDSTEIMITR